MDKLKIMDQVTVYKNIFSDSELDLLLKEIKKSENSIEGLSFTDPDTETPYTDYHGEQPKNKKDGSLIYTWVPWYTFGSKSIWGPINENSFSTSQKLGYDLINNAIKKAKDDYLIDYGKSGKWVYNIENWEITDSEESLMMMSHFEILKHKRNLNEKYNIGVHTDWHNQREEEPGPKQILTFTIYLNDDYEGGEIDFVDERNKHLIVYKPKRGDVTVFPSGRPYWHGARSVVSESSKYFIRTFLSYRYEGSKRWRNGISMHGVNEWIKREQNRLEKFIQEGSSSRQLVFKGEQPQEQKNSIPIFIDDETFIDGRDIE